MAAFSLTPPLAVVLDIPASPGVLIAGGIMLCTLIAIPAFKGLLDIISWFRGTPSAADKFATKDELRAVEQRIADAASTRNRSLLDSIARSESRMIEIDTRINHQLDQGQALFTSLQREMASNAAAVAELRGRMHNLRKPS